MPSTPNHFLSPCSSRKLNNTVLYPPVPNLHFNWNLKIENGKGGNWNLPEKQYIPWFLSCLWSFLLLQILSTFPSKYLCILNFLTTKESTFLWYKMLCTLYSTKHSHKYIHDPDFVSGYICFMKFVCFTTIEYISWYAHFQLSQQVSKFWKQILKFSFEPINEQKCFWISALASRKS